MTLFNFPNMTAGPDQLLVDLSSEVSVMPIALLLFTYIVVFSGGSMAQARRSGYIDPPMWSTIALLICDLIALLFSTKAGIIGPITLVICIALTLFSAVWLFLTRGRFEP